MYLQSKQLDQASPLRVRSYGPGEHSHLDKEYIVSSLASGMPDYGIEEYFALNPSVFKHNDIVITVENTDTDQIVATLAADWSQTRSPRFLWIRFLYITERWHKNQAIKLVMRRLLQEALKPNNQAPGIVVLRTKNPSSFDTMSLFSFVPGTVMYPFINKPHVPEVMPKVRAIAEEISPGRLFIEQTGVLKNAAANGVDFYPALPKSGKTWIDAYFEAHMTQKDFLLCCIFVQAHNAAKRLLRTFGVEPPHNFTIV